MARKNNSVIGSLGSSKRIRPAEPKSASDSDGLSLPSTSIKDDPYLAARREEILADNRRLRAHPQTVSMESLLDWEHQHPQGLGATAGTGLTTKIRFLAPGEVESYDGSDISPYDL